MEKEKPSIPHFGGTVLQALAGLSFPLSNIREFVVRFHSVAL